MICIRTKAWLLSFLEIHSKSGVQISIICFTIQAIPPKNLPDYLNVRTLDDLNSFKEVVDNIP